MYGEVTATFLKELQEQLDEKEQLKHANNLIRVSRSHGHSGKRGIFFADMSNATEGVL